MLRDTAIRGGLAVSLYVAFPPFSDIHRLWERANGLNESWPAGSFEYPPWGALYFEPLVYLPSSRWAVAANGLLMVVAAIAITWVLIRIVETSVSSHDPDLRLWVASPALLLLLPINWDVLVVLISVLGVLYLYQSRSVASGVMHGIGTAFKVFPGAIVLPVLPLITGWRRRFFFLASGFAILAGSYLVYAAIDPDGWRFHLDFASSRTDIESTIWGVFDGIARGVGLDLSINTVNTMSAISLVAAFLLLTAWVAWAKPTFAEVAALALTVLVALNKTFKPQYVLWILPFYAWIRLSRVKVRVLEATAIVAFVVVYFAVPKWINPIEASIRFIVLGWLAVEVIRRVSRREAAQAL